MFSPDPNADDEYLVELEAFPAGPGPRQRTVRSAIQALLALLGAVPAAWAALTAAGVDIAPGVTALVLGCSAASFVLVSAVWNSIDQRRGLG